MTAGLRLAVIGAGPVGLALALLAAERLPTASITVHDARPFDHDVARDARTLALALGSVQLLQRLKAWAAADAAPIHAVHVSEQNSAASDTTAVQIRSGDVGVPMLGAVLPYGRIVAPLQGAWLARCRAEPERLFSRFGDAVRNLHGVAGAGSGSAIEPARGVSLELGSGSSHAYDLAVVAEGGVFADQARKAVTHDYQQTAWVGTAWIEGGVPGMAFERFTRQGPLALLPLPPEAAPDQALDTATVTAAGVGPGIASGSSALRIKASLVWCTDSRDDPVAPLSEAQRIVVLNTLLPAAAGQVVALTPLKRFPLGLNAERTLVGGPNGRVVRIGNAAQTLHPVAGQGLNLGFRDAYEIIDQLLRSPHDVARALRRAEWQRAPDRWALIATTDFLARSFTWQLPGIGRLRAAGLAALEATPPLKRLLAEQFMYGQR